MLGLDRRSERWIVGHRVAWLDPVFRGLTEAGTSGAVWLALALALALSRRSWRLFAAVALADLCADLTTRLLQLIVARPRPSLPTLVARPASFSFPSGHAATSFACATVIAAFVPTLRLPAFLLALAIAYSRLYVGVHYPLDVIAGGLYGVVVGLATLRVLPRLAAVRRR
jgi:undecaprenyl-diphosphatase